MLRTPRIVSGAVASRSGYPCAMGITRLHVLLLLVASLTGCATLDESACNQGDWFGIGERDGRNGHHDSRLVEHRKACAKYGIAPDEPAYRGGYWLGLQAFCVPPQGFALGRRNGGYHGLCPQETEAGFLQAMELGGDVWLAEQDIAGADKLIEELRDDLKDDKTTEETRKALERELERLKLDRRRHEDRRDMLLERARARGYGEVW